MGELRFSRRAEADLLEIGDYTARNWSKEQAARYLSELERCCEQLAANPGLGRSCEDIRPGLLRREYASHVVFFRKELGGVLISRILHKRMLPEEHSIGD